MKKLAITLLLALTSSLFAHAAVTEIRQNFVGETSLLSNASIMTAPTAAASYLLCGYLDQPGGGSVAAELNWTDENSQPQSFALPGCVPVRVLASTAPTVSTSGSIDSDYDLSIFGLGFWTTGSQGQGGLSEPLNTLYSGSGSLSTTTLGSAGSSPASYLLVMGLGDPLNDQTVTILWTDPAGPQSFTYISRCPGGTDPHTIVLPVRLAAAAQITMSISTASQGGTCQDGGTPQYSAQAALVLFGIPASGSGPLTDYESHNTGWTNFTPSGHTAFSDPIGDLYFMMSTVDEVPNSGTVCVEAVYSSWFSWSSTACSDGSPSTHFQAIFGEAGDGLYWHSCNLAGGCTGSSPTYDIYMDALRF